MRLFEDFNAKVDLPIVACTIHKIWLHLKDVTVNVLKIREVDLVIGTRKLIQALVLGFEIP